MPITDRLMLTGSWSLQLDPNTPQEVLAALDPDAYWFGHVIITPTRGDPDNALETAWYTGVYRSRPPRSDDAPHEIGGPGLAMWLGDEDDKGQVFETAFAFPLDFDSWIPLLLPVSITAGTIDALAGTITESFQRISPRKAIDIICAYKGAEWRINPDGSLDAGLASSLFVTTPTLIVNKRSGGRDITITGLRARIGLGRDAEDYTTRVFLEGNAGTGFANISPATPYKDLQGNAVVLTRYIESTETGTGNETAAAQAQLNRFTDTRRAMTIDADAYHIEGDVKPGDSIYVYDVELGLVDTTKEVEYRGQTIHPMSLRALGVIAPFSEGMGCVFRNCDGDLTDLSEYVIPESTAKDRKSAQIEVGAIPRPSRPWR